MPNKRSYVNADGPLTPEQLRRKARDEKFRTSHSECGKKFIEVDSGIVKETKAMVQGKQLHRNREKEIGFQTHHGRVASQEALKRASAQARYLETIHVLLSKQMLLSMGCSPHQGVARQAVGLILSTRHLPRMFYARQSVTHLRMPRLKPNTK